MTVDIEVEAVKTRPAEKKLKAKKTKQRGNGQGTVWKEDSGIWRWQVTLGYRPDGKRITRSGSAPTKGQAERAMTAVRTDYQRGLIGVADDVTVAEYTSRFLKRHDGGLAKTNQRTGQYLDYALEHIGNRKLRDVRPQHLKDLMVQLAQRKMEHGGTMSPTTLKHVRAKLKALFNEAVSDQLIHVNPMASVKRNRQSAPITAGEVFDEAQLHRFAAIGWALHSVGVCRLFPALFITVSLGLRREEIAGLKWKDVDLEAGILRVRQVRTGGTRNEGIIEKPPKNDSSRRDLFLPGRVVAVLRALQDRQSHDRDQAGELWQGGEYVISTEIGGPISPDNINRALNRVIEWSDSGTFEEKARHLPRSVTREAMARLRKEVMVEEAEQLPRRSPHDLRHTYATLALRRSVPVEVVSKNLGHASVSITLDIYRHVLESEKKAYVVDLFDALPVWKEDPAALN